MSAFHFPWLSAAIPLAVIGAIAVLRLHSPEPARRFCLAVSGGVLALMIGAWLDFARLDASVAGAPWSVIELVFERRLFSVDALSAPLLPLVALVSFLTALATLGPHAQRFRFASLLISEAILLATLSTREPWVLVGLLAAGAIPPGVELFERGKPPRVYLLHALLFVGLLFAGQALVGLGAHTPRYATIGVVLLAAAVLMRSGVVPVHCWMTDLFENASFGTALLFVTPIVGAYAAVRLVLPIAPPAVLYGMAAFSLFTAVYAAAMALVQREARRFFCYMALSHTSLVFIGLETATPIGLTGALCVWMALTLSLTGFGLSLRAVEARTGRLSLDEFHGLFPHTAGLAVLFLITGLASIGFPGTAGFVATEVLLEGALQASSVVGIAIVLAAALNGLAVLQAYFRIFTGAHHVTHIDLGIRRPERVAVLVLTALIFAGGLYPQPGVASRYDLAGDLVRQREQSLQRQGRTDLSASAASRD